MGSRSQWTGTEFGQVPRHHHGRQSAANETFPCLIRTKRQKRTLDEFSSPSHATNVGHNVVGKDQAAWKNVPKESVENIVHDILELTDGQAQHDDCPTKLIDLKANVASLQRCNGDAKGSSV
eukprot:scaffold1803_cov92-Amphora_coffeaeformis.AAC.52